MAKEKIEQVESLKDIEVKPRLEKISEKHLEQLQKLVNSVNTMQFNIGKIESQKHTVLHNLSMTQDRIGLFQDTLQKEYGTFDVNIEDGTINWPKEEDANNEK
tara:strand:+ start:376 stop:684 length:309 start_codon:yes stop_codon:yes gene_type:complete